MMKVFRFFFKPTSTTIEKKLNNGRYSVVEVKNKEFNKCSKIIDGLVNSIQGKDSKG